MSWDWILSVISGLAVCIPLVIKLVEFVIARAKEKNWSSIVRLVLDCMIEAEMLYDDGADRKEYVMSIVEETARTINYTYDEEAEEKVSLLIDEICAAAKTINSGVTFNGT